MLGGRLEVEDKSEAEDMSEVRFDRRRRSWDIFCYISSSLRTSRPCCISWRRKPRCQRCLRKMQPLMIASGTEIQLSK